MLALANVERAHDRAISSVTSNSTICESAEQSSLVRYEAPQAETPQEPQRDEAAEAAKLAAHQQAAMKIVAQHMIQQVDTATANHERVMELHQQQLAGLGHTSMDDQAARRAIETQLKESERAHNEQLKSLEEKASVALSHVETQHAQAIAKLKREFAEAAPIQLTGGGSNRGSSHGNLGNGDGQSLESGGQAPPKAVQAAEALLEWNQLEDEKKSTMRAAAQRLMAEMHEKQALHDKVIAAARERVENATSDVARALFTDDIRLHEQHHAKELQDLEAQATQALASIDRDFTSRANVAKAPALMQALPQASSEAFYGSSKRMTGALELAPHSQRMPVPQSESRMQAITWLQGQERSSEREDARQASSSSSSKVRVTSRPPVVRVSNSAAANRARSVRQAYETLGVDRNIADPALDRVYASLLQRENPANNPSDCSGYYAKKTKEIRSAYAVVRSNRHPGAGPSRSSQNVGADIV